MRTYLLNNVWLEPCVVMDNNVVCGGNGALANMLGDQEEVVPVSLGHLEHRIGIMIMIQVEGGCCPPCDLVRFLGQDSQAPFHPAGRFWC